MTSPSKNIFWLTLSRAFALILLAVAYVFLFRYLGTYGAGQYQFVLSYVTIFGIVIDFGVQQYIIKKMSEEPEHQKRYFHNFIAIEAVLAIIVYSALTLISYLNHYDPVVYHAILISGLGMVSIGLTYPFLAVMSANHDLRKVAFINFMNSLINVIFIFSAVIFEKYIVFLVTSQVVFGITSLILYYQFVKKHLQKPAVLSAFTNIDWKLIKTVLRAAAPFALLVGFSTIYNRIDTVLIYRILGPDQTGLYSSAYKFFDLIGFFPSVVSFSLYPIFAGLMVRNEMTQVRETIEKYFRFLIALALPIGVGGSLLALPIIIVLAGEQFISAAPVLAILVWAPAILISYIVANSLVISQLTRFAVIITSINMVINVAGNIVLLPILGIKAAAIMTVISEAIQALLYIYFVKTKIADFAVARFLWKPVIASAVMGVVIWFGRTYFENAIAFNWPVVATSALNLVVLMIIGVVVYGGVLAILKFFKADDMVFVKSLVKRA